MNSILENATRQCLANGTWALKSDYSRCVPINSEEELIQVRTKPQKTGYRMFHFCQVQLRCSSYFFLHDNDKGHLGRQGSGNNLLRGLRTFACGAHNCALDISLLQVSLTISGAL